MEYQADARLVEYIGHLSKRWGEGIIISRVDVSHEDWKPTQKQCHDNVTQWVKLNPESQAVRGWLLMDLRAVWLLGQEPRIELLPHSVIENAEGRLLDITPATAIYGEPGTYPFIRHNGTEEEFMSLVGEYNLSRIRLYGTNSFERMTYSTE